MMDLVYSCYSYNLNNLYYDISAYHLGTANLKQTSSLVSPMEKRRKDNLYVSKPADL